MSMRLTGEGVKVTLRGKREDIDAVLLWFENPVLSESDVNNNRTVSEIKDAAYAALTHDGGWGSCLFETDEKNGETVYKQMSGHAEGFSRDFWGWIIRKINEISPDLEIESEAEWWQTVTGAPFTAYIGYSDGKWYDDDELDEEWAEREYRREELADDEEFEDFECEWDDDSNTVVILEYTGNSESAYIPASVSEIYGDAFDNSTSLTSIAVSDDNRNYSSFDGMLFDKKKTSLIRCPEGKVGICTIPDSVTAVYDNAFIDCENINDFAVSEDNKKYMSQDGCLYNKNKTTLLWCVPSKSGEYVLPETVTKIDDNAFDNCLNLVAISVSENNKKFTGENGILYNKGKTKIIYCPLKAEGEIRLPKRLKNIGYAFDNRADLTTITIPDGVTEICHGAFENCTSLAAITLPNNMTEIGSYVFRGCTSLTAITIPDGVTKIGYNAFEGCTSLAAITIPDSVTKIEASTFEDCQNLTMYGSKDSIAKKYANARHIPFVEV